MVTSWGSHLGKRGAGTGPTKRTTAQFNEPAMIAFVYTVGLLLLSQVFGEPHQRETSQFNWHRVWNSIDESMRQLTHTPQ